jgi:hypothetical protein
VVIATSGPAVAYFANVASYAAIIGALAAMRPAARLAPRSRALLHDVADGLRYTLRRPLLRAVLVLESSSSLFGVNTALVNILATDVLHAGPETFGLLLSAEALGELLGTAALLASGDMERKGRVLLGSALAYSASLALLAFARSFEIAAALLVANNIADAYWTAMRNTIFQLYTDEAYRGRTMSTILLTGRGFTQAGQLESGIAVAFGGPAFAMLSGAALCVAAVLGVNARVGEVRDFRGLPEAVAAVPAADQPGS